MFLGTVRSEVQDQKKTIVKLVVVINLSLFFMVPCFTNYYSNCNSCEDIPVQYHVLLIIIESIIIKK